MTRVQAILKSWIIPPPLAAAAAIAMFLSIALFFPPSLGTGLAKTEPPAVPAPSAESGMPKAPASNDALPFDVLPPLVIAANDSADTPTPGVMDSVQDWLARANRAFQSTVVRRLSTPTSGESDDAIAQKLRDVKDQERAAKEAEEKRQQLVSEDKRKAADAAKAKAEADAKAAADSKQKQEADAKAKEDADAKAMLEDAKRNADDAIKAAQKIADERQAAEQKKNDDELAKRKAEADLAREAARKADEDRSREAARKVEESRVREAARKADADRAQEAARKADEDRSREAARKADEDRAREVARKAEQERTREDARKAKEERLAAAAERKKQREAKSTPDSVPPAADRAAPRNVSPSTSDKIVVADADGASSTSKRYDRRLSRGPAVKRWIWRQRSQCRFAGRLYRGRYTVRTGDTLWLIAERFYHSGWLYRRILHANRWLYRNPDLIHPCDKLYLPRWRPHRR